MPIRAGTQGINFCEPHLVELPSGKLIGMIRVEKRQGDTLEGTGLLGFSLVQTESTDGGQTWGEMRPLGFHSAPPHLLRHSSGLLILSYGYRQAPFGQRIAFSRDNGNTWAHDWIIRNDGLDGDLGYPATVELPDGSLFTAYYQRVPGDTLCSLLWSHWQLP